MMKPSAFTTKPVPMDTGCLVEIPVIAHDVEKIEKRMITKCRDIHLIADIEEHIHQKGDVTKIDPIEK